MHEMYIFEHEATAQTAALTDYRYIGNDPYNYVYFNCDSLDNQNGETCEVWRIIGVFDVERKIDDPENDGQKKTISEKRIKLIRGNALKSSMSWDTKTTEDWPTINYGKNDWYQSQERAFLDVDYYNGDVDDGLKESARNMIDDVIFYLGGYDSNSLGATESIYTWERGINVYNKRNTVRPTKSLDKVGLMYASDVYMVYANGVDYGCYNNPKSCYWANAVLGWVYNSNVIEGESNQYSTWLISPDSSSSYAVFGVDNSGILTGYSANGSKAIRPVVYLSADVKIIDGDGSSSNPYKLSGN